MLAKSCSSSTFVLLPQDALTSDMLKLEQRLVLEPSADWIKVPQMLLLHHGSRAFQVGGIG
jgi:hypothetical protein